MKNLDGLYVVIMFWVVAIMEVLCIVPMVEISSLEGDLIGLTIAIIALTIVTIIEAAKCSILYTNAE